MNKVQKFEDYHNLNEFNLKDITNLAKKGLDAFKNLFKREKDAFVVKNINVNESVLLTLYSDKEKKDLNCVLTKICDLKDVSEVNVDESIFILSGISNEFKAITGATPELPNSIGSKYDYLFFSNAINVKKDEKITINVYGLRKPFIMTLKGIKLQ